MLGSVGHPPAYWHAVHSVFAVACVRRQLLPALPVSGSSPALGRRPAVRCGAVDPLGRSDADGLGNPREPDVEGVPPPAPQAALALLTP